MYQPLECLRPLSTEGSLDALKPLDSHGSQHSQVDWVGENTRKGKSD